MMTLRPLFDVDGAASPVTVANPATVEVGAAVADIAKLDDVEVVVEAGTQVVIVTGLYPVVTLV